MGRDKYVEMLEKHCNYRKNDPNLFELLRVHTDTAIHRAKRQYEAYTSDVPPSRRCPATRVFELVEELKKFL